MGKIHTTHLFEWKFRGLSSERLGHILVFPQESLKNGWVSFALWKEFSYAIIPALRDESLIPWNIKNFIHGAIFPVLESKTSKFQFWPTQQEAWKSFNKRSGTFQIYICVSTLVPVTNSYSEGSTGWCRWILKKWGCLTCQIGEIQINKQMKFWHQLWFILSLNFLCLNWEYIANRSVAFNCDLFYLQHVKLHYVGWLHKF